jgi:hypothetical protein
MDNSIKKLALKYIPSHQRVSEWALLERMNKKMNKEQDPEQEFSLEKSLEILEKSYPIYYESLSEKAIKKIYGRNRPLDSKGQEDDEFIIDNSDCSSESSESSSASSEEESEFSDEFSQDDKYESESDFSE